MRKNHFLLASLLAATAFSAGAANYYVLVPLPKKAATAIEAPEISVTLSPGALPNAKVGHVYSQDLSSYLQVTGDPAFDPASVGWSIGTGTLPPGLTLGPDGRIAGQPTVPDTAGSSFQVVATYAGNTGQQVYTIRVADVVLHVRQVVAGDNHTCAITTTGGLKCWGLNSTGQLGDGSQTSSSTPVDVLGLTSGVASVAAGTYHTCAVTTAGSTKCWGHNGDGQLGDNTRTSRDSPVDVVGLTSGVTSVAAGLFHSCAVTASGVAKCWGNNNYGQLGNGIFMASSVPTVVQLGMSRVVEITVGLNHSCARTTAGGALCWGHNGYGQLGDGTQANSATPLDVFGLTRGVVKVEAGGHHTCAINGGGGLKCWGNNGGGQVGDGTSTTTRTTPVDVVGLTSGVADVAGGLYHTCAVTTSGGIKCWGANSGSQLGDGTSTTRKLPVDVVGLTSGVAFAVAGHNHSCAVTLAGDAKCWGSNNYGQLGDGSTTPKANPVVVIP